MSAELAHIADLEDLEDQGHALAEFLRALERTRRAAIAVRKLLVDTLRRTGHSHAQVAAIIEVERSNAAQIASGTQNVRRRTTE